MRKMRVMLEIVENEGDGVILSKKKGVHLSRSLTDAGWRRANPRKPGSQGPPRSRRECGINPTNLSPVGTPPIGKCELSASSSARQRWSFCGNRLRPRSDRIMALIV